MGADDILVSDEDRAAVVRQLQKHTADGRLTIDEFSERVDETYRARTGTDLRSVLRNLPPTVVESPPRAPARSRPRSRRGRFVFAVPLAMVFIVLGILAMTGTSWFPLPVIILCVFWTARRRHAYH